MGYAAVQISKNNLTNEKNINPILDRNFVYANIMW